MKINNRKDEIIKACIHMMCEKGAGLSSMQAIADEVGIAKGTLYFYFDSKETLYNEVFEYCHQLDVEACNVGLECCENALDKLCKRFENIIEHAIQHPEEAKVENIISLYPMYQREHYKKDFTDAIIVIMQEGMEQGEVKEMSDWLLTELYYGITMSMYMKFIHNPDLWNDEKIRKDCCQFIRDSFKK